MLYNRSTAKILESIRFEIDHAQETTQSLLLQTDSMTHANNSLLSNAASYTALLQLLQQRVDATHLYLADGGSDGGTDTGWLLLLWQRRNNLQMLQRSRQATVLYSGADAATMLATTTLFKERETKRIAHLLTTLPEMFSRHLTPNHHPTAAPSWDALPFWLMHEPATKRPSPNDESQDWLAWGAMAFVVVLVALAVIV